MEFINGAPYFHFWLILFIAAFAAIATGLVARMKQWDMERVMTAYILTTIYYIDTELGRTCTLQDLQQSCRHLTWFNLSLRKLDQVAIQLERSKTVNYDRRSGEVSLTMKGLKMLKDSVSKEGPSEPPRHPPDDGHPV